MSAPVDVLAVMDCHASGLGSASESGGIDLSAKACKNVSAELREARAAVAELIAEFRQLIADADASGITAHYKGRGFDESIERGRAALARVGGAA